ncbi:MAG: T9SS type A sorting domain-containing protein [Saprospirales bacterium]|nr:T9SS type A sorting domain-containing protein [Saprospirales bacterium]MBK7336389.1 T9SS type A sorting domain-containing protein [Saprospirales bacterium]
MIVRISTLLFMLALPILLLGQTRGVCGFDSDKAFGQNIQELKKWVAEGNLSTRGNVVTYVPVKFHIISKNDGSKGLSEQVVLDALCHLNEEYADQDIQFYIYGGIKYIKNDLAYNNPGDAELVLQGNKDSKAMNIFMGLNANPPGGGIPGGTTLGYFAGSPSQDWIIIKNSEVNGFASTIPHEVGHYFNLDHPFNGWDCTAWTEAEHGNPVSSLMSPCDPSVPNEFANGDNCQVAGDFLCDTPADYNLGYFDGNDCNYTGNCKDPNGDQMQPDEDNFMGYFNGCADYFFSGQQKQIIAARLLQRTNLETDFIPSSVSIDGTTTLVQPADNSTTPAYNNVAFEWTPVAGANQYLLEVDLSNGFSVDPQRIMVWGTYKVVQGLIANKKYYWRVRPFNAYNTCAPKSPISDFTTGTAISTVEPPYVTNWSVRPNPVSAGQSLQLEMNTRESFEASVELRNLNGQTLQTMQAGFSAGNSTLEIPTSGLANGIYILTVQSSEGILNERIVIAH